MATIAEQLTSLADAKSAIKGAIISRGVPVSDTDTLRSYADKIGEIGETVPETRFGASIDTFLGTVDADGVCGKTAWTGALNFAGVKEIGEKALYHAFDGHTGITSVNFGSLTIVKSNGLYYAFNECTGITSVNLSSLTTVETYGMNYAFYGCSNIAGVLDLSSLTAVNWQGMPYAFNNCDNITGVNLGSLTTIGTNGLTNTFYSCGELTSADFSSLATIDTSGMSATFAYCSKLETISFPSLTSVQYNSFGAGIFAFTACISLTEIHFRADMQATIEAMTGYASKFGASNATIYFDL